jgi:hypothetical protein
LLFLAYLDSAPHHNIVALAEEWQDLCKLVLPNRISINELMFGQIVSAIAT